MGRSSGERTELRIPDIAIGLFSTALDPRLPADLSERLNTYAAELRRRNNGERRRPQSATFTPELAAQIRAYHAANPNLTQAAIARHFNVNNGRVSEALHGKRT